MKDVEKSLAKTITNSVKVPTIGIGSSAHCDGQILVTDDLLGLNPNNFRFVKKYVNLRKIINKSVKYTFLSPSPPAPKRCVLRT